MEIKPVGYIYTDFKDKFGIPRQSGRVAALKGRIVLEEEWQNGEAIRGIEGFSHLWLIFGFSEAEYDGKSMTVRPPRLGGNTRIGVFASRSPYRPNSLGLSCVKLEGIEDGALIVSGVDILDATPIYDIKPYIPYADSRPDATGSFAQEQKDYCLRVEFEEKYLSVIPKEKREALLLCLGEDPRPSYHTDDRVYSMHFSDFDVHFTVSDEVLKVIGVDKYDE